MATKQIRNFMLNSDLISQFVWRTPESCRLDTDLLSRSTCLYIPSRFDKVDKHKDALTRDVLMKNVAEKMLDNCKQIDFKAFFKHFPFPAFTEPRNELRHCSILRKQSSRKEKQKRKCQQWAMVSCLLKNLIQRLSALSMAKNSDY